MRLYHFLLPAVVSAAVSASFGAEFPNPYPAPAPGVRLTPEIPLSPSINGARIVGATPGSRMLFQVPVSGERPSENSGNRAAPRPEDGFARIDCGYRSVR